MGMNVGGGRSVAANINMTPMIDILLVLLIIFMAISPVHQRGLEALAPQPPPPNSPPPPDTTVVIQIARDLTVRINQEPATWDGLEKRLMDIFKTRNDRTVFVKGDPELDFSVIAKAIDAARGANIDKVGLMTPKVEEGKPAAAPSGGM